MVPKQESSDQVPSKRKFAALPVFDKLMMYLAMRDHSERELRTKLRKTYETEEIESALLKAKDSGYLPDTPQQLLALSQKIAAGLHRKRKGIFYINNYLRKKGLPAIAVESEIEIEKATALLKSVLRKPSTGTILKERHKKIRTLLANRGFQPSTIITVLKTRIDE